MILSIISITKDDFNGISNTIKSTNPITQNEKIEQLIIDSSKTDINEQIKLLAGTQIKVFKEKENGISKAFNNGIHVSKGEWLWFLNGGDELINTENGELMLNIIKKSTADIIIFKIAYGEELKERDFPPMWLQWPPISSWMPHPGMICKRNLFDKFGLFDTKYKGVMDFEKWLKMTSADLKVDLISIPLVKFDTSGFSSTQKNKIAKECIKAIHKNSFIILKTILKRNWLLFNDYIKLLKSTF